MNTGTSTAARRSRASGHGRARQSSLPVGFVAVSTAMLWLTSAIASAALWPIYQSAELLVLVVVVTVTGSVIAIAGAIFRWSSFVLLLVSMLAYLALGVPLAVPGRALFGILPSGPGLLDLVAGTALSWKQLLTITLPAGSYQGLLIPAFLLVLLTVVISLSVSLRAKYGELGVLGPIVLFLAAIAFGSTRSTWPIELSLGLTAAILLWLIWWRWYRRRTLIRLLARQAADADGRPLDTMPDHVLVGFPALASAGLIMAIAAGAAIGAAAVLPPTGDRVVLRSSIAVPFDPREYPSPLVGFRKYEQVARADDTMFTVSGLPEGGRIRIATLDSYDGIVYSVGSGRLTSASGSFTRVPYAFDQSAVRGSEVKLGVTVVGYTGVWLPTIGKFESIEFSGADAAGLRDSFHYNDITGTAAVVRPLTSGDSYTLSAVLPKGPTSEQRSGLQPGSVEVPRTTVLPNELSVALDGYVRGIASPGDRLAAMVAGLKTNGYISHGVSPKDPPSRSGHAADRITELLTDQRMIGDQEQYAVTAALMAKELGFPARVVFGFVPATIDASGATPIRGADVSAWIEVNTTQFGWVDIDPTPPVREIPAEIPQEPTQVARPQSPVLPPPTEPNARDTQTPPDSTQDPAAQPNPIVVILLAVLAVLGWLVLAAAIVLAPFLTVAAAKLRRRVLRRRARTPIQRISGGWQEFEDAVVDHGYLPPAAPTRTEVAQVVGGVQPLVLAAVADRAVFAPEAPHASEADQVWRAVGELRAALNERATRWQRIKALVSVRSLGGYSVTSLFKR